MPNEDLADGLRVLRPMLKGHIRQTRTLLAVLVELERDIENVGAARELRLSDQRIAEEAERNGTEERVG